MFCNIYKWLISRSLDSGKGVPGIVSRHLGRCRGCREFSRLSQSLDRKLVGDASRFLQKSTVNDSLNKKIILALAVKQPPVKFQRRRFLAAPVPALAAAVIVLAVAVGIILQTVTGPVKAPGTTNDIINDLSEFSIIDASFREAVGGIESPMETEIHELKQTLNSAAEFIISGLDIKIDQETE